MKDDEKMCMHEKRCVCMEKDVYAWKMMCMHGKRCVWMEKDLLLVLYP